MAKVFIQPDSDGDLHTAAMHNNKFQVILNEINGNLDEKNLKYPNSRFVLSSSAGPGGIGYTAAGASVTERHPHGWCRVSGGLYVDGWGGSATSSVTPLTNSFYLATQDFTVTEVLFTAHQSTTFNTGQDWTFSVEKSNQIESAGTWTTIASITNDLRDATTPDLIALVPSISVSGVSNNDYLRVSVTTPSTWTGTFQSGYTFLPPPVHCKITCTARGVT